MDGNLADVVGFRNVQEDVLGSGSRKSCMDLLVCLGPNDDGARSAGVRMDADNSIAASFDSTLLTSDSLASTLPCPFPNCVF